MSGCPIFCVLCKGWDTRKLVSKFVARTAKVEKVVGLWLAFTSRDKGVTGEEEAGGTSCVLGDADAGSNQDVAGYVAIVLNLQIRIGGSQVGSVVTLAGYSEGATQPAGAGGGGSQTANRLNRAKQNAASPALRLAGDVQAKVHAIDEIDIGMTRWAEQHRVSCSLAGKGVRSRIGLAKVSFQFDDAAYHPSCYQQLSQQFSGDQVRGIQVEAPRDENGPLTALIHGLL
jgi:hypothetical protein